ncbi:2772_t:CDS:1, partial [Dentiscutata erythropus]
MPTVSEQYTSYSSASGNCNLLSSFTQNATSTYMFNDVRQRQRNHQQIEENHNSFQDSLQSDSINNTNPVYEPRSPTQSSSSSIETVESGDSNSSTVTLSGLSNPITTSSPFYSIFSEQKGYWIPNLSTASNDDESVWQKFQPDQQRWRLTAAPS